MQWFAFPLSCSSHSNLCRTIEAIVSLILLYPITSNTIGLDQVFNVGNKSFDGTDLTAASAKITDLTSGRVVLAGTSGALEDSNNGLMSAKRAKLKTVCSPSEYHIDDNFEQADFICEEFTKDKLPSELRQLIYT